MTTPSTDRTLAVLGYHKIGRPGPGGWDSWFYIPEEVFTTQLSCLRSEGWEVLDVAAFLRGLETPETWPARAALLTFDDGYRSVLDVALPCLRRFGYPAVLFVPTDFIGDCNRFDVGQEPEEPLCDWDQLLDLERAGVAIQSHGCSHRHLSSLNSEEQWQELVRSRAVLEERLQRPVELFSFPYGDNAGNAPAVERMLEQAGYRAAFLYGGGPQRWPVAAPYRLSRLAMGPDTDLQLLLREAAR